MKDFKILMWRYEMKSNMNNMKRFECIFENDLKVVISADSKDNALWATSMAESILSSRIVQIRELDKEESFDRIAYFDQKFNCSISDENQDTIKDCGIYIY